MGMTNDEHDEAEGRSESAISADAIESALIELEKGQPVLLYRRGVSEPIRGDFQSLGWNELVSIYQTAPGYRGQTLLRLEEIVGVTALATKTEE